MRTEVIGLHWMVLFRAMFDLRSNAFSMSSQKVHLDVSDVSHVTQSDGSFQTKVTLQQHINPQDVSQYVSRDGAIVSEGMIYQVLDNGVDESGSAFLVVSGYVASGVSVGALSDLRATEEGFDQTNLQIGHAHQGDIVVSASAETSKIFFQSRARTTASVTICSERLENFYRAAAV